MSLENLTFTYDFITPEIFWNSRYERFLAIKQSKEFAAKLDYMEREVTKKIVKRSLELAIDRIDEWLDHSFTFDDSGNVIGVEIKLLASELERAVADQKLVTQSRIKELVQEIIEENKE